MWNSPLQEKFTLLLIARFRAGLAGLASWVLKNQELGLVGLAGFWKHELGLAGLAGFEKIKVSYSWVFQVSTYNSKKYMVGF